MTRRVALTTGGMLEVRPKPDGTIALCYFAAPVSVEIGGINAANIGDLESAMRSALLAAMAMKCAGPRSAVAADNLAEFVG